MTLVVKLHVDLPSRQLGLLVLSSSLLEVGSLVHEHQHRQGRCREDKFLGVHINLLIKVINYNIRVGVSLLVVAKLIDRNLKMFAYYILNF